MFTAANENEIEDNSWRTRPPPALRPELDQNQWGAQRDREYIDDDN